MVRVTPENSARSSTELQEGEFRMQIQDASGASTPHQANNSATTAPAHEDHIYHSKHNKREKKEDKGEEKESLTWWENLYFAFWWIVAMIVMVSFIAVLFFCAVGNYKTKSRNLKAVSYQSPGVL